MKKLVLSMLAFVFTITMVGQKSQEELRLELAKGMVSFNSSLKTAFNEAKDYNDFKTIVCGSWASKISKEGDDLLKASYDQLKNRISEQDILQKYSGKEMAAAAFFVNDQNDPLVLFGGKTGDYNPYSARSTEEKRKCKWWQLLCHLQQIFGEEGGKKIMGAAVEGLLAILKKQ